MTPDPAMPARQATEPLCVLIIVENLPVPLDRRVWQEACALRDAGYTVVVICPQMRGWIKAYEVLEGIHIYRHWISDEASGFVGFLGEYASALWGETRLAWTVWRTHRPGVIHLCNPPDLLFLVALPYKLLAGIKVIYDVHDLWPEMFEAKFRGRGIAYWCVRLAQRATLAVADVVLATNESVRSSVARRGRKGPDDVLVVRTAPHDMRAPTPFDPELRNGKRFLVGYIGVMGRSDGVQYLLEAAHHVTQNRKRDDIQFLLMGTGPEYADLLVLRDRLGLQTSVAMPGRVSNDFLFTALQTMDLGVACDPINEYNDRCTMNKTLEYMAFGKAQVMFATCEGRYSAGESARYVTENSSSQLGDAIIALLDDETDRVRMGELARERLANELNWGQSVNQLLAAYDRVMRPLPRGHESH